MIKSLILNSFVVLLLLGSPAKCGVTADIEERRTIVRGQNGIFPELGIEDRKELGNILEDTSNLIPEVRIVQFDVRLDRLRRDSKGKIFESQLAELENNERIREALATKEMQQRISRAKGQNPSTDWEASVDDLTSLQEILLTIAVKSAEEVATEFDVRREEVLSHKNGPLKEVLKKRDFIQREIIPLENIARGIDPRFSVTIQEQKSLQEILASEEIPSLKEKKARFGSRLKIIKFMSPEKILYRETVAKDSGVTAMELSDQDRRELKTILTRIQFSSIQERYAQFDVRLDELQKNKQGQQFDEWLNDLRLSKNASLVTDEIQSRVPIAKGVLYGFTDLLFDDLTRLQAILKEIKNKPVEEVINEFDAYLEDAVIHQRAYYDELKKENL